MHTRTHRLIFGALAMSAALWSAACIPSPDFDDRDLVKTPRILAIIADRPEIGPGQSTTLSVVFADPLGGGRPVRYRWRACITTEALGGMGGGAGFSGAQFGMMAPGAGCASPETSFDLGEGETAVLTAPPEESIDLLIARFREMVGDAISDVFIERLLTDVGIQLSVQVDVTTDGAAGEELLITGFKRVIVSRRTAQGTNPPLPRVEFGDFGVISGYASASSGFDCATESGGPLVVPPSTLVALRPDPTPNDPLDSGTDEPWTMDTLCMDSDPVTECYGVLDPQGIFTQKPENAFYSWNATAGVFFEGTTIRPARDNEWTSPATPGDVTFWVVMRDGHGGTSACRATITVR